MRKAFSLLTAIVVMVLMASIAALVFGTTGKIVKETTAQFQKEQAVLLARSYTELAVLTIQNSVINNAINCEPGLLQTPSTDVPNDANVTVTVQFIGLPNGLCSSNNVPLGNTAKVAVLIDVDVQYTEPDTNLLVHYTRRTLQGL